MNNRELVRSPSVLDSLSPLNSESAKQLMERAHVCNALAKIAAGPTRVKLYRLKDANIQSALLVDPSEVETAIDCDWHRGLLSVRLRSQPSLCLHTHENWLDVA